MKLATYRDGSKEGQLVLVSADLKQACYPTFIAHTMSQVLDDWLFLAPQLQDLYKQLNQNQIKYAFPFSPEQCLATLPRSFRIVDADLSHIYEHSQLQLQNASPAWVWHECAGDSALKPASKEAMFLKNNPPVLGCSAILAETPFAESEEEQDQKKPKDANAPSPMRLLMLSAARYAPSNPQQMLALNYSPVAVSMDEVFSKNIHRIQLTLQAGENKKPIAQMEHLMRLMNLGIAHLNGQRWPHQCITAGTVVNFRLSSSKLSDSNLLELLPSHWQDSEGIFGSILF